jgi:hypothetical protein
MKPTARLLPNNAASAAITSETPAIQPWRFSQRQQWQTCRAQQAAGPGQKRPQQAHAQPAQPPPDAQVQVPGHFCPVQPAQAGGDIGQQHAGQPIPADDPGDSAEQGQHAQFDDQAGDQATSADAAGSQVAQQTPTLFKRQPNCRMNDKQPDHERQKTQSVQVQVKAFGEPPQIVVFAALAHDQFAFDAVRQRGRGLGKLHGQDQAGNLPWLVQQLLGKADVHHQQAGGHVGLGTQRWQRLPGFALRAFTLVQAQRLHGLRGNPGVARRGEEVDDLRGVQRLPRQRGVDRQGHRFDTEHGQALIRQILEDDSPAQRR